MQCTVTYATGLYYSQLITKCVAHGCRKKNMHAKLTNLHYCTCYRFW